jgi:hypothetical protein
VVEKRELAEAVQRAIASLPAKYRLPLTMFHLDGLSYQKVADFLDVPLGTAKSLISRAREKLRLALGAYYAEEIAPAVQEVFNEHRLPAEFARKVLENIPKLGWGTGRECTFAGALEAALTPTDRACKYCDIIGFTGLAFRVRWFCGNEKSRWCTSCAVGEMDEEIEAVERTTGWPLRVDFLSPEDTANVERLTAEMVASIDAGRPVLACEPRLNVDVVFGYEEGGRMLLLRDYFRPEKPLKLPASKLGFLIMFIGDRAEAMPRREAVIESLKTAARNWRRDRFAAGPGEYWYGKAALDHWIADLGEVGELSQQEKEQLSLVSWWNFNTLHDARRAAVTYLEESAALLRGKAAESLRRAAKLYQQETEMLGSGRAGEAVFSRSPEKWTPEVQRREQEILARARELEERAIAEMQRAPEHIESH